MPEIIPEFGKKNENFNLDTFPERFSRYFHNYEKKFSPFVMLFHTILFFYYNNEKGRQKMCQKLKKKERKFQNSQGRLEGPKKIETKIFSKIFKFKF